MTRSMSSCSSWCSDCPMPHPPLIHQPILISPPLAPHTGPAGFFVALEEFSFPSNHVHIRSETFNKLIVNISFSLRPQTKSQTWFWLTKWVKIQQFYLRICCCWLLSIQYFQYVTIFHYKIFCNDIAILWFLCQKRLYTQISRWQKARTVTYICLGHCI